MTAGNLKLSSRSRLYWIQVPYLGIILFLALYFYASTLYPGGTKTNPMALGYSHLDNYWCDLLDKITYGNVNNSARPFALLATVVLPLSLMPFWFFVPLLLSFQIWQRRLVRLCGCSSMILAAFIYTPAHDYILSAASLLGFFAFMIVQWGIVKKKKFLLTALSNLALLFCMTNFFMWKCGFFIEWMPLVQRAAFFTFFIWVLVINRQIELCFKQK